MKKKELSDLFERAVEVASRQQDQLEQIQEENNKLLELNSRLLASIKASEERETRERRAKLQTYAYILSTEQWKLFKEFAEKTFDTPPEVFHNIVVSQIMRIASQEETKN